MEKSDKPKMNGLEKIVLGVIVAAGIYVDVQAYQAWAYVRAAGGNYAASEAREKLNGKFVKLEDSLHRYLDGGPHFSSIGGGAPNIRYQWRTSEESTLNDVACSIVKDWFPFSVWYREKPEKLLAGLEKSNPEYVGKHIPEGRLIRLDLSVSYGHGHCR